MTISTTPPPNELHALQARNAELQEAKERIEELEAQVSELNAMLCDQVDAFDVARRHLQAHGLLERFDTEIVLTQEQNRLISARNGSLMTENAELIKQLKAERRKTKRLEKAQQEMGA